MKHIQKIVWVMVCLSIFSFAWHKFYVSIYQITYAPEKKALHITARIFTDDLNEALFKTYHRQTNVGEANESTSDIELVQKYLQSHFTITLNNKLVALHYLSNEKENNVIICYFKVTDVNKVRFLEVKNTALFEVDDSQQNIIQLNFFQKKQNLLLTPDNVKGLLKI